MLRIASLWLLVMSLAVPQLPAAEEPTGVGEESHSRAEAPLRLLWQATLQLDSPTNVVIGRVDKQPRWCVQGTLRQQERARAAIELLAANGRSIRVDQHGDELLEYHPGAYVQWIDEFAPGQPAVAYSYAPASDERPGGARLIDPRSGALLGQLHNTTRFGNNNSLLADLDGDGRREFVYADQATLLAVQLPSLQPLWRWSEGVHFCWSLPAVVNLDRRGPPEIVFGSEYNNADGSSSLVAVDASGKQLWRSDGHQEDLGSTPVFVADVDFDGMPELLKVGLDLEHRRQQAWNHLHVFDLKGQLRSKIPIGCTGIALGDLDGDRHLDAVGLTNTRDGGHAPPREIRCLDLVTGQQKWAVEVPRAYLDTNSPWVGDVNGDGRLEVVLGTGNPAGYGRLPASEPWGDLYVVSHKGEIEQQISLPGWPVNLAACDTDDDGRTELTVVVDGQPGSLFVFQTGAPASRSDWPEPFADSTRTGTIGR